MFLPKKGIYRHFKGKRYELIDFASHSETMETMVVYRALYGEGGLWVRPLSMWSETVERDGRTYTRFLPEEEYLRLHSEEVSQEETDPASQATDMPDEKHRLLKDLYGYDGFREGQEEVIDSILSGRDTLAILPTGAGKSICYQLPAQMLQGVALVISPLISLMKDQVNALTQTGIPAAYLNSSLSDKQFDTALKRMKNGEYRIVYVAPERLLTQRFLNVVQHLDISMVAVDEAHCISQWGQDFRPSYLDIPLFIGKLSARPRLCAFTATATMHVQQDIVRLLEMQNPYVRITGFNRPNLYFSVTHTHEKDRHLLDLLNAYRGFSGIVYCGTRKNVESVCENLLANGYLATRYHAGLSEAERQHNQEEFIYDRTPIMVATNAFGMGIDKSNVRFVIHYNMPKDLESYYQEAGRAGRDGERADCHLLFEPKDIVLQRFFIDKMGEEVDLSPEALKSVQENARVRLNAMIDYCRTTQCLRQKILRYFGEVSVESCNYCANCLNPYPLSDVTGAARMFIGFVREYNGKFGVNLVMDVLGGLQNERIRKLRLDNSLYHGTLKGYSQTNLRFVADALIENEILQPSAGRFPYLQLGNLADEVVDGVRSVYAHQEATVNSPSTQAQTLDADIDAELFERLRQLRQKISKSRSIPPYAVCNDASLIDMCRKKPIDIKQLQAVKGMGHQRIQAYGTRFIKIIRDYMENK